MFILYILRVEYVSNIDTEKKPVFIHYQNREKS